MLKSIIKASSTNAELAKLVTNTIICLVITLIFISLFVYNLQTDSNVTTIVWFSMIVILLFIVDIFLAVLTVKNVKATGYYKQQCYEYLHIVDVYGKVYKDYFDPENGSAEPTINNYNGVQFIVCEDCKGDVKFLSASQIHHFEVKLEKQRKAKL